MILLLGISYFYVGKDEHSGGKIGTRVRVDATDFLEDITIMAWQFFIIIAYRVETIVNIFFIGIATYM
jgi:hypothetical protein